jgi:hypothetical protein
VRLSDPVWALELAGYRRVAVAGDVRLDQADARRMTCEDCGRVGLRFTAWRRDGERAHRGIAWCPRCTTAVEL